MTPLSMLLSFKYVALSQQASAWLSVRRGKSQCVCVCLCGGQGGVLVTPVSPRTSRLCDAGVRAGCWDRPETDMTGPLTRTRLHAGSSAAVQHKQDFCSLFWACSKTHSRQLRRLSHCAPLASTKLITAALTGVQNPNTENRKQLSWQNARCFSETLNYVIRSVSGQSEQSVLIKTPPEYLQQQHVVDVSVQRRRGGLSDQLE